MISAKKQINLKQEGTGNLGATALSAVASAFVMFMHRDNVKKAMSGEERQIRAYFKKELFSKKC